MNEWTEKAYKWVKDNATSLVSCALSIIALPFIVHVGLISNVFLTGFFCFLLFVFACCNFLRLVRVSGDARRDNTMLRHKIDAIEACGEGVAILDEKGHYIFMNRAHAQFYGYDDPSALIGQNWRSLYTLQRIAWFEHEVFPALKKCHEWRGHSTGKKKDGSEFPQELRLNLLDDGGLVCIVRDISEKLRNENLLKMIKVAVEAADDGVAITDAENRLLFMNRSYLQIHGYDPFDRDQYIGTDWRLLYNKKGQAQINDIVLPTTILKGTWSGSMQVMKRDGTLFYGDASLTKLPDGTILGVMRDITARRSAEMEREELREQLFMVQKMEAISRLTHGITHDFNNILSVIQGYCQTIQKQGNAGHLIDEHVVKINDACLQARELVDQLMAFTRKKDQQSAAIDLRESILALQKSFDDMMPVNVTPMIDFHVETAMINAQSVPVNQAIRNLVVNAVESIGTKPGKVTVTLKESDGHVLGLRYHVYTDIMPERTMASVCRHREFKGRDYLITGYLQNTTEYYHLIVADTGGGIDKDALRNIFDPFFTTKRIEKRAGLGLFAVMGTVIGCNGAIIVETVPGEGSSFHLFLPKAQSIAGRDNNHVSPVRKPDNSTGIAS